MHNGNNQTMINKQIIARGLTDHRVIDAFKNVDRAAFVPTELQNLAYEDFPLSIGYGQTISQPYIVAYMTEAAEIKANSKVLEIGTGSGYQAAILSKLRAEVYSVEVIRSLGETTAKKLKTLGYTNVHIKIGDGYQGWKEAAPFDVIIATAAPEAIPETLIDQLKEGGKLIIPVGSIGQTLIKITKTKEGIKTEHLLSVRFVPMVKGNN